MCNLPQSLINNYSVYLQRNQPKTAFFLKEEKINSILNLF